MKITLNRSDGRFWLLYFFLHFSLLLFSLLIFKWIWSEICNLTYALDLGEACFIAACYAVILTVCKYIYYRISQKQYQKNPVDRRRNNLFRE